MVIKFAWTMYLCRVEGVRKNIKTCFRGNGFFFFWSFCPFQGRFGRHMEVPRLGVQLELQSPAHARATETQDPSHVCNLHHSSRQRRILNPLSKARDRTRNLMVPGWIHLPLRHDGNSRNVIIFCIFKYNFSKLRISGRVIQVQIQAEAKT